VLRIMMIFCLMIFIAVSLTADVFFGFQPEVVDVRSAGLGRTTVLTYSGSGAVFANPAGLSLLKNSSFQAGFRTEWGGMESDESFSGSTMEGNKTEWDYALKAKINNLSLGYPIKLKKKDFSGAIAIGYRAYYDRSFTIKYSDNSHSETIELIDRYHGGYNTLTIGMGINAFQKLSIGIAANFTISNDGYYDWDYQPEEYFDDPQGSISYSYSGSFYNLGIIYQISRKFKVGAVYKPAMELTFDYDLYEEGAGIIGSAETKYDVPEKVSLSLQYSPFKTVHLFLEYQTTGLDEYKRDNRVLWRNTEAGNSWHLAIESSGSIPSRLGFFTTSIPLYDTDYESDLGEILSNKPNSLMGVTAGSRIGLRPNIDLDLAFEYTWISNDTEDDDYLTYTYYDRFRICLGFIFKLI
jgi:hypothetical protein